MGTHSGNIHISIVVHVIRLRLHSLITHNFTFLPSHGLFDFTAGAPGGGGSSVLHPLPNEVIAIADRRIRVAGGGLEEGSIYNYCRQWSYNNPNPPFTGNLDEAAKLPPLHRDPQQPPMPPFNAEEYDIGSADLSDLSIINEKHTRRWKAAGQHMRKAAAEERAPHAHRLQSAIN